MTREAGRQNEKRDGQEGERRTTAGCQYWDRPWVGALGSHQATRSCGRGGRVHVCAWNGFAWDLA
eukprot:190204-Chlamydomonas_euryale.AAC.5